MKYYGQIPGGNEKLKDLLYPFDNNITKILFSKYRWWKNRRLNKILPKLNNRQDWLTVIDRLGAPGDALITANVIRCIKVKYPKLKINCITPHPELIKYDRSIDSINKDETYYSFDSSYWELIVRKESRKNIIAHNMARLGIKEFTYNAHFVLSQKEKEWAKTVIPNTIKPIIAICTRSKESVKNWPKTNWGSLVDSLRNDYFIIQIGDKKELNFNEILSFSGKYTMRESAALLSQASLFIGPDSLLMHIANGLEIPSVILFGGSRPVPCLGYDQNINLSSSLSCSPCWIHDGFETCSHQVQCMHEISNESVLDAVTSLLNPSTQVPQFN